MSKYLVKDYTYSHAFIERFEWTIEELPETTTQHGVYDYLVQKEFPGYSFVKYLDGAGLPYSNPMIGVSIIIKKENSREYIDENEFLAREARGYFYGTPITFQYGNPEYFGQYEGNYIDLILSLHEYEIKPTIFSSRSDYVDFNNLSEEQKQAIIDFGEAGNGLGGGDTIILPSLHNFNTRLGPDSFLGWTYQTQFYTDSRAEDPETQVIATDGGYNIFLGEGYDKVKITGGMDGVGGNSAIYGGGGENVIEISGNGNNSVSAGKRKSTITITGNGNNVINGATDGTLTDSINIIGDGDNNISAGNNAIYIDILGIGDNILKGGVNGDEIDAGWGNDQIDGGGGDDKLRGNGGNDTIKGGAGDDVLIGGTRSDFLDGQEGSDIYIITNADEYAGDEVISDSGSSGGLDEIRFATAQNSSIILNSKIKGIEKFVIGKGEGLVADTKGKELVNLDASQLNFEMSVGSLLGLTSIQITGNNGENILNGSSNGDTIFGMGGADQIYGGNGEDSLYGGEGNDFIYCGIKETFNLFNMQDNSKNFLYGGDGNDTLFAASNQVNLQDTLDGGAGIDDYYTDGKDYIVNFEKNETANYQTTAPWQCAIFSSGVLSTSLSFLSSNTENAYLVGSLKFGNNFLASDISIKSAIPGFATITRVGDSTELFASLYAENAWTKYQTDQFEKVGKLLLEEFVFKHAAKLVADKIAPKFISILENANIKISEQSEEAIHQVSEQVITKVAVGAATEQDPSNWISAKDVSQAVLSADPRFKVLFETIKWGSAIGDAFLGLIQTQFDIAIFNLLGSKNSDGKFILPAGKSDAIVTDLNLPVDKISYEFPSGNTLFSSLQQTILDGTALNAYLVSNAQGENALSAVGNSSNNKIYGNKADNFITGLGGNDILDGALGSDTASYSGRLSDYTLIKNPNGSIIVKDNRSTASSDGMDTLTNIEFLKFADQTLSTSLINSFPGIDISCTNAVQFEGQYGSLSSYQFTVTRSGSTNLKQSVSYSVTGFGTSKADKFDFEKNKLPTGTVTFNPNETSKTFTVNIIGDLTPESDEQFAVTLSKPSKGVSLLTTQAVATIRNDDTQLDNSSNSYDGTSGNDVVYGMGGDDSLYGFDGADYLVGGLGKDTLSGGAGTDIFRFESALGPSNIDTIVDFALGDKIELENSIFKSLKSVGDLKAANFVIGDKALSKSQFIIYNQSSGTLFYDSDGSGTKASAIQFAQLTAAPSLSAGDFKVT